MKYNMKNKLNYQPDIKLMSIIIQNLIKTMKMIIYKSL